MPININKTYITITDGNNEITNHVIGISDDNKTIVAFLPNFAAIKGLTKLASKFPMANVESNPPASP